jgi:hypothetical protein
MTNRLGRVLDRSRALSREYRSAPPRERRRLESQVEVLWGRAKLLQRAILLAIMSVLLAAIQVIVLFLTALLHWETAGLIGALFVTGMLSLIASLVLFLVDLDRSLAALRLELRESRPPDESAE